MAKTLLKQLFDGEIYPAEQIVPKSPEYKELCQKLIAEKKYLRERLSASDQERFEAMENMSQAIAAIYEYEDFSYGFRLGVGLMIEVFANSNGLHRGDE
jgi:hypothetical protein